MSVADDRASTVGASTYERIKHDIIFGLLEPGSKLKLDALKSRYSASVSTLRETLNRLSSEGFVDAAEQRGFFVKPVSVEDITEIAELRILLECSALKASFENGDTDWEGGLVAAHHKLSRMEQKLLTGDSTEREMWKRYDWEFHKALIQACRSTNLLALHEIIYDKYLRYQMLVFTYRGQEAVDEHRAMFDAALVRDVPTAQALLEAHVMKGLHHTLEAMASSKSAQSS
ncbi:MAG: GntR family transcriptional regulator [Hyphomicrobiales bacterium]